VNGVSMTSVPALQIVNSGDAYLNVHNMPNPMGVIRGQARSARLLYGTLL